MLPYNIDTRQLKFYRRFREMAKQRGQTYVLADPTKNKSGRG